MGIFLSCFILVLFILQPVLLKQVDLKVYDLFLVQKKDRYINPAIAIVDIDEKSLQEIGQWPWPRYNLARLIDTLNGMGAASIGLDILLAEEDRTSPDLLKQYLKRDLGVKIDFLDLPDNLKNNDMLLAKTLEGKSVVLGSKFLFSDDASSPDPLPKSPSVIAITPPGAMEPTASILEAKGITLPLECFLEAADIGPIDVSTDVDGLVRRVPLLIKLKDKVYPNIALRTLMSGAGINNLTIKGGEFGLESIHLADLTIPVSPDGSIYVQYKGPGFSYSYYSASDILNDKISAEDVAGRIVFVGSSAIGLMDIRATPLDSFYPGVEVHAATVDSILSSSFVSIPPWTPAAQALAIFLVGISASLFFGLSRPVIYLSFAVVLQAGIIFVSKDFFDQGIFLSPLYASISLLLAALSFVFLRFWLSERQKKLVQETFGQYVAPEIVAQILEKTDTLFEGEKKEVTVMFTDVRNFTGLSERLRPDEVVALLNRYFTPITALIRNNSGTLDKFIGDALMAFWNAPIDVPKHADKAVETSLRIQENMYPLNKVLKKDFNLELEMGIGLHTGEVFVGNMGSEDLLDYTIIGDNVNIASRLEALCPVYGAKVIASKDVKDIVGEEFYYIPLDRLTVKGRSVPIEIFEPIRMASYTDREKEINRYLEATSAFKSGKDKDCFRILQELIKDYPNVLLYKYHWNALENKDLFPQP